MSKGILTEEACRELLADVLLIPPKEPRPEPDDNWQTPDLVQQFNRPFYRNQALRQAWLPQDEDEGDE